MAIACAACGADSKRAKEPNRGAITAALRAVDVGGCLAEGDPAGRGHLRVRLEPDGTTSGVVVDRDTSEPGVLDYANTSTGHCVAERFAKVRVPPFEGEPIWVGRVFTVR